MVLLRAVEINCSFCIYHSTMARYIGPWGIFFQIITLVILIVCLKAGLGDSGEKCFKI